MSRHGFGRVALIVASALGALALFSPAAFASGPPIVTVGAASNFTLNTATLNGTVDKNGASSTTYKFEYGKTKLYGTSTTVKSTSATGAIPITEVLVGLEPRTTYHFRISATNSFGTTVSEDVQFEMLLQWKVEGKALSEVSWGELPTRYRASSESPPGTFNVTGTVGTTAVEISCAVDTVEHPASGALEREYNMHLEGCSTKLNGTVKSRCKPADMDLAFNAFLVVNPNQPLQLGPLCDIGNKWELGGAGFGAGPMTEQLEQPISFSATLPVKASLTMTYTSKWYLVAPAAGRPFGIS